MPGLTGHLVSSAAFVALVSVTLAEKCALSRITTRHYGLCAYRCHARLDLPASCPAAPFCVMPGLTGHRVSSAAFVALASVTLAEKCSLCRTTTRHFGRKAISGYNFQR